MPVIHTALLSFGMSGQYFHAPFIQAHPGFRLAGAWERSRRLIQQHYPDARSYTSLEEVLADPAVDLVVVNTPNHTHHAFAKAALLAGKHVLVEKAFTCTVAEARELQTLAVSQGRILGVYHNRRYDSDFLTVQQVMASGVLGTVLEAELRFERFRLSRSAKLHKESPNPGAGLLKDLGPHLIDQACVLFGRPDAVFADIRTTRPGSEVDDWFDIRFYYGGLNLRLLSGMHMRFQQPGYILHGTAGSFVKSRADIQEQDLLAGKQPGSDGWGAEPETAWGTLFTGREGTVHEEKIPSLQGNYGLLYASLHKAIRDGKPLPVSATEGVLVMELIEAALRSHESRQVVTL